MRSGTSARSLAGRARARSGHAPTAGPLQPAQPTVPGGRGAPGRRRPGNHLRIVRVVDQLERHLRTPALHQVGASRSVGRPRRSACWLGTWRATAQRAAGARHDGGVGHVLVVEPRLEIGQRRAAARGVRHDLRPRGPPLRLLTSGQHAARAPVAPAKRQMRLHACTRAPRQRVRPARALNPRYTRPFLCSSLKTHHTLSMKVGSSVL